MEEAWNREAGGLGAQARRGGLAQRRPPAPSVRRPVALGSESLLATASITLHGEVILASVALPPPLPPPPPPPPMLASDAVLLVDDAVVRRLIGG